MPFREGDLHCAHRHHSSHFKDSVHQQCAENAEASVQSASMSSQKDWSHSHTLRSFWAFDNTWLLTRLSNGSYPTVRNPVKTNSHGCHLAQKINRKSWSGWGNKPFTSCTPSKGAVLNSKCNSSLTWAQFQLYLSIPRYLRSQVAFIKPCFLGYLASETSLDTS